jgi:hypothetical protein
MRPHMEEYRMRQIDIGSVAMMKALVDGIVKTYEENAHWKTIQKEVI